MFQTTLFSLKQKPFGFSYNQGQCGIQRHQFIEILYQWTTRYPKSN